MNEFREWLSDNLRYFILGFAIIIIMLLLFFGYRFLTNIIDSEQRNEQYVSNQGDQNPDDENQTGDDPNVENPDDENQTGEDPNVENPDDENQNGDNPNAENPDVENPNDENPDDGNNAGEDSNNGTQSHALEKNQYAKVNVLLDNYYKAFSNRDVETLKELLDYLSPEDEKAILNSDYIESYSNVNVYTKPGVTKGSYVAFVCYGHKYKGYDTILPGASYLYVDTAEDGSLYIVSSVTDEQMACIEKALNDEDTQKLLKDTQKAYDEALESDAQLKNYLSKLGVI